MQCWLCIVCGNLAVGQVGLLLQCSRMSITLFHQSLNAHVFAVEVQYLSVLCAYVSFWEIWTRFKYGIGLLNLICKEFFSVVDLGNSLVLMAVPWLRAFGGMFVKNSRADLALMENGLSLVLISVMKRVIMLGDGKGKMESFELARGCEVRCFSSSSSSSLGKFAMPALVGHVGLPRVAGSSDHSSAKVAAVSP